MMNCKDSLSTRYPRSSYGRRFMAILGLAAAVSWPGQLKAQLTLDGTNCIIFADMFDGELARCVARRPDGSTLKISLIGRRPNSVKKIELSINGLPAFQAIDIKAEPTIDSQNIGLLITDMNFDKLPDFAVMEFAPAGANTPYLYFLFNAETGMFDASPSLSRITAPIFDEESGTIISRWRDNAARSGKDRYVWRDGKPALVERVERTDDGSQCHINTYSELNGELKLVKSADCTD